MLAGFSGEKGLFVESRLAVVLEALDAGVVIHAPDTSILDANTRARELLGIRDIDGRVAADPAWVFMDEDERILPVEEYPVVQVLRTEREVRGLILLIRRPEGSVVWVEGNAVPLFDEAGELLEVAVTFIDVTARESRRQEAERLNAELARLSVTDALTGLTNRRGAFQEAERMLASAPRRGRPVAFLMVDLDNFKEVNDLRGHMVGDRVLSEVAVVVRSRLRAEDVAGRIGGDELLLVLPNADADESRVIAKQIREAVSASDSVVGLGEVTCSIGIAVSGGGEAVAEVVHRADRALYRAKHEGGNRVGFA